MWISFRCKRIQKWMVGGYDFWKMFQYICINFNTTFRRYDAHWIRRESFHSHMWLWNILRNNNGIFCFIFITLWARTIKIDMLSDCVIRFGQLLECKKITECSKWRTIKWIRWKTHFTIESSGFDRKTFRTLLVIYIRLYHKLKSMEYAICNRCIKIHYHGHINDA